jgi:hypothetical protein
VAFGARDAESPTVYGGSHGLLSPRGGLTFDVRGSLPPGAPAGHSVANAHLIVDYPYTSSSDRSKSQIARNASAVVLSRRLAGRASSHAA